MPSHEYTHPKVVSIKAMSPHRKTEVHAAVAPPAGEKAERPRASPPRRER